MRSPISKDPRRAPDPQSPRGHLRPGPRRQSRGALRPRPRGAGGRGHRGRKRCGAAERGADGADLRGLENAEGEGDLEICYGHSLVLTGYFYGITHSINGVLLVLITHIWPQLWRFSWNNLYVTCLYKLTLVDEIIIERTYEKIIRSSSSIGWMFDVFSLSLVI